MSEFELAELAGTAMSNFLTSFTVFISIVTAYVVAAFAAGRKLTKLQVSVVNTCFLIASVAMGLLSVFIFRVFLLRTQALANLNDPDIGVGVIVDVSWEPQIAFSSTFSPSLSCAELVYDQIKTLSQKGNWQWLVTLHPKMAPETVAKYRALENET